MGISRRKDGRILRHKRTETATVFNARTGAEQRKDIRDITGGNEAKMIDYHKTLIAVLNSILPTHYEMTLHSGLAVPCISYTLEYSRISYRVKVWGNDIAEIQQYAMEIDKKLRPLGWRRTAANELYDNQSTMIQKILTYEALGKEEIEYGSN